MKVIETEICEFCEEIHNIDNMRQDEEGNWFCDECLKTII